MKEMEESDPVYHNSYDNHSQNFKALSTYLENYLDDYEYGEQTMPQDDMNEMLCFSSVSTISHVVNVVVYSLAMFVCYKTFYKTLLFYIILKFSFRF